MGFGVQGLCPRPSGPAGQFEDDTNLRISLLVRSLDSHGSRDDPRERYFAKGKVDMQVEFSILHFSTGVKTLRLHLEIWLLFIGWYQLFRA